jgi:hypothetical protein
MMGCAVSLGTAPRSYAASPPTSTSPISQIPSPAPPQTTPTGERSAKPSAQVLSLRLGQLEPDPVLPNRPATLQFKLSRAVTSNTEAVPWQPVLTLTIDGHDVPASIAFTEGEQTGPQQQSGNGTLAFVVPRQVLTSTFFGLYTGGSHLLVVSDGNSLGSDIITFQSAEPAEFWILVLGPVAFFAAVGYVILFRRFIRRQRLRTYPEGLSLAPAPSGLAPPAHEPVNIEPVTVPDGLVAALAEGGAILVAGPSLSAHAGIPVGTELLKWLLAQLGDEVPTRALSH